MYLAYHTVLNQRLHMPMPHSLHITPVALISYVTLVGVRVVVLDVGAP